MFSIGRHSFKFLYVVGKGGFGKVWRVEFKSNRQEFALKEMLKTKYYIIIKILESYQKDQ